MLKPRIIVSLLTVKPRFVLNVIVLLAALVLPYTVGFAQTAAPRLDTIVPASGAQGTSVNVTLSGSGFTASSEVVVSGAGIVVQSKRFVSATSMEATLVLSARATGYSVSVSTKGVASNPQTLTVVPGKMATVSQLQVGALLDANLDRPFADPFHIWVSGGYAYVTDYTDSTIKRIALSDSSVTTLAGQAGEFGSVDGIGAAARFGQPAGVWSDGTNVYVSDSYFGTIRKIALATAQVTTLAGDAASPSGAVDGIGAAARFRSPAGIWGDGMNLYICDSLNFTIRKMVLATGQVTTLAGQAEMRGTADGNGSAARFYAPVAVWGDGASLFVADAGAIRKVSLATGAVTTLAGNPAIDGFADGNGSEARFSFISGIWGDGANLFIADSGNDAIRKVSPETGAVATIAGQSNGDANGAGQDARFDAPSSIAGDGTAIYLVDRLNAKLKQATAASLISNTPAGNGTPSALATTVSAAAPVNMSQLSFQPTAGGGMSRMTAGQAGVVQTGYGLLRGASCCSSLDGLAIFGYRNAGVLVSEATVSLSELIQSGRILATISDTVNTGMAIANPNAQPVTLSFYFTAANGSTIYSGKTEIPAGGLTAGFLNESPFAPSAEMGINLSAARTFTFSASAPVGVTAIRGLLNERAEFLMTTLPVFPLATTSSAPVVFAHYADGGGWSTQLLLVNPTDNTLSGQASFFKETAVPGAINSTPRQSTAYSIPARSSVTIQLSGDSADVRRGWIRVTPSNGMVSPAGLLIFSFKGNNGVTMTEAGIPAVPAASAQRLFVEAAGDFNNGQADAVQSGLALANSNSTPAIVNYELFALDGTSTGLHGSLTVPAYEQVAMFLNQMPGFEKIQTPFQGLLQISGDSISAVGLRGHYNERGEFLITSTAPTAASSPASSSVAAFPYFVNGGGYNTQFVIYNRNAGQASSGVLSLFDRTGAELSLPIR